MCANFSKNFAGVPLYFAKVRSSFSIMRPHNHRPERIRQAREAAGYTKTRLADEVGCSISLISEIESGTRNCTPKRLEKIAKVLKVREKFLASESFRPPKKKVRTSADGDAS